MCGLESKPHENALCVFHTLTILPMEMDSDFKNKRVWVSKDGNVGFYPSQLEGLGGVLHREGHYPEGKNHSRLPGYRFGKSTYISMISNACYISASYTNFAIAGNSAPIRQ